MRYRALLLIISTLCVSNVSYANWFNKWCTNMAQLLMDANADSLANLKNEGQIINVESDIDDLMKQVNGDMTGSAGWGSYQFSDFQSYGSGGEDWAGMLSMSENGNGSGALGQKINSISGQFPIDTVTFNTGNPDPLTQRYYALQSQTVLATRAASELDFDKIQQQISYQQMLLQQVDKTKTMKSAMDLSNRIEIEGNLIGLEVLRQTALQSQQQSMVAQANINAALTNSKFLSKS